MTYQEIEKNIKTLINQEPSEVVAMYSEVIDENLNSTLYSFDGFVEMIVEAIESEGHEENDYSEYPTLNSTELYNIYTQVK